MNSAKKPNPNDGELYEIRLRGHLEDNWSDWFDGLAVARTKDGETTLAGYIPDQAALHGLLAKVRDLGLKLVSVRQID